MGADAVWADALAYIEGKVPRQVFDTWFTPVQLERIEEDSARLLVPNKFFGDWLRQHYGSLLSEALVAVHGREGMAVAFVSREGEQRGMAQAADTVASRSIGSRRVRKSAHLNPKYSFASFVVGASNQFAHAACLRVAEAPAHAYNPLFIYGGVGLGKTHLLNAIGNHVGDRMDLQIAYVTTEQFTNEVINSIRYDKMTDLRRRYRNIDMLLVDDVQFLAGKELTQE